MSNIDYTQLIENALNNYQGASLHERLMSIHTQAINNGDNITYPHARSINLVISTNTPYSIPLPVHTDFNNCHFTVKNNTNRDLALFSLYKAPVTISFGKDDIFKGNNLSTDYPALGPTPKLLRITDEHWTERTGFTTNVSRNDLLYIEDYEIKNEPIAGYSECEVEPSYAFYSVTGEEIIVENAKFTRNPESTKITKFLWINGNYNVKVCNIEIFTPTSVNIVEGDECFSIEDSAKLLFMNIIIHGTYSTESGAGYGFGMSNVYNSSFINVECYNVIWGLFGTNNTNVAYLYGCSINRFDIHCYGRDVVCENCTFKKTNELSSTNHIFNRFSSMYGSIIYRNCSFERFRPLRIDPAYNAYTPFKLIMINCYLRVSNFSKSIIDLMNFDTTENEREELKKKYLPNIEIIGLSLHADADVSNIYVFKTDYDIEEPLSVLPSISHLNIDIDRFEKDGTNAVNLLYSDHNIELLGKSIVSFSKEILDNTIIPII